MRLLNAMVRNDLQLIKERRYYFEHSIWMKIYSILAILIAIGLFTWGLLRIPRVPLKFNMGIMFWYIPILLFVQLIIGLSMVRREWRNGTAAWWLTLPYSRSLLLMSKAIASFVRFFQTFFIMWCFALFFVLEVIVLRPDVYKVADLLSFFYLSLLGSLWMISLCPAIIFIGISLGILIQSRLKPLVPLAWVFIIIMGNFVSIGVTSIGVHYVTNGQSPIAFFTLSRSSLLGVLTLIASVIIGFIFLKVSAYLLEHKVEM